MANVVLNFNAFLEKTKLKDDGSNYTDWVRNLRIILIAAKKEYVLQAPLGDAPEGNMLTVKGYVDARFDTDPDDSKSQTGYVFTLNGGAVSWCSSKQSVMADLHVKRST